MKIRIIAETPQEKGKSFERLIGIVLDKLGYTDIHYNIHATGIEIDVKAKHKVTNNPLICECKAHEQSIASTDLTTFYGKFHIAKGKNPTSVGYFFSTSGFNGTAKEWYEQNIPSEDKSQFKIFDNEQIVALLRSSGLLIDDEDIESKIKAQINHTLDERYVVVFESRLYIVQIFRLRDTVKRFVVYTLDGNLASRIIHEQISKIDTELATIPLVNLEIFDKVLLSLLDLNPKSISDISAEIVETVKDAEIVIEDLNAENLFLVNSDTKKLSLKRDINTITNLTKRFTESKKHTLSFMNSVYVDTVVDFDFVQNALTRFMLEFNDEQKKVIMRAVKIFPSVLSFLLLSNTEQYLNFYNQSKQIGLNPNDKIVESQFMHFMNEILENVLSDLRNLPADYLDKKNVAGYASRIEFKIASEYEQIFSIDAFGIHAIHRAGSPIKIGEIVSASDASVFLRTANMCLAMDLYDQAITEYNQVINNTTNNEWLKAAWSNKGLAYLVQNKHEDAEPCFDKALEIDPNIIQALSHKAKCREKVGDSHGAQKLYNRINELGSVP